MMSLPQKVSISRNKIAFGLVSMLIGPFLSFSASAQDVFPDKALEAAVRWEVFEKRYNDQPITAEDVKNISQVVGRGKGIKSLEGLQHCKVIMKIDLANNEVTDLTPIANLKQVQFLDVSSNKLESVAPIAGLTQMQYLQLSKNSISDLGPIKDMIKMNALYLNENKIKSVEPIAGLKKLWTLQLAGNPLETLPALPELKGVKTLNLKNCGLKKLDFIKDFKDLSLLMLDQNAIETFAPLVESCEADTSRRFAPFLRLYVDPKQIESLGPEMERLRAAGVRINPETK